jgi:hypothetical protein
VLGNNFRCSQSPRSNEHFDAHPSIPSRVDYKRNPGRYLPPKEGVYPKIAGLTLCFWYPKAEQVPAVELEPHGLRKIIQPGGTVSFTEDWYLLPHKFPAAGQEIDL